MAGKTNAEVVAFTMGISGGSLAGSYRLNVEMDYTNSTRAELIEWAMYGRKVALASVLRKKSDEYMEELSKTVMKVHAREAGANSMTPQERAELVARNLGISVEQALKLVNDPTLLDKLG